MALLSLGLESYEPHDTERDVRPADTPKPEEQLDPEPGEALSPSELNARGANAPEDGSEILISPEGPRGQVHSDRTGNIPGADGRAPQASAEQFAQEGVSQDNWSETGLAIIRSVLRDADTRTSRPAEPITTETGLRGPAEIPKAPEAEITDFSAAIEELQRQLAPEMAEDHRLAPETKAPDVSPYQPVPARNSAPALGPSGRDIPAKLTRQTSAAATKPGLEIPAGPTWMAELGSGPDKAVSTATEFLSLAIEELRSKLEANDVIEGLVPSPREASELAVPMPVPPQSIPEQNGLSKSPANQDLAKTLPVETEIHQFPVNPKPVSAPVRARSTRDWTPKFATFRFGYLPSRGLVYSLIMHEVVLFGLFLLITYGLPSLRSDKLIVGSVSSRDHVIFLPEVGGGTEGEKSPGGGESKPQQAPEATARGSKGLAYSGSQAILSNPPNPTNAFQTVLRPLVVHPERLKKLVPLPNIVEMAKTRLPSDLIRREAAMPHFRPPVQPIKVKQDSNLSRQARWDVPVKPPQLVAKAEMPKLAAAEQPLPQAPKAQPKPEEQPHDVEKPAREPIKVRAEKKTQDAEKDIAPPSTAQVARLAVDGKSQEPLLSLSPAPIPAGTKIPAGEARGRFAITPGGKLNPNSVNPGKPGGTPSESPAAGEQKSHSTNGATELASNTGAGAGHNPATGGGSGNSKTASGGGPAGADNGSGRTAGPGAGGAGTGNGRASAGGGAGRSGTGAGTGSGAGSGAGSGSFPGISIQGGEGNEGTSEAHFSTIAPQTPYQMTIVATASSGGGLPDYGVFENQRVYTVYVPMQRTPQEPDPTWTLQYALEDTSAHSDSGELLAPAPVMREWPQIPAELERTYAHQQVIVYAVLGADGKLTHISIKHTPDARVSAPIVQALGKWVFRPAQLDDKPVSTKILIGIPL